MEPSPRIERILLGIVLAVHLAIALQGIGEMYLTGHHGWAGAMRSIIGRNYSRLGFVGTRLLPLRDTGPIEDPSRAKVHWHHPPGINIGVGVLFAVFGEHEASARLLPVLSGLASFVLLYLIVRRRHGPMAALASAAVFSLLPMQVEYGKIINYEPTITALVLLALWLLERLREGRARFGRLHVLGIVLALCAAGFVDWPAFIFAFFVGAEALIRRPRKPWVFAAVGLGTALLLVLLIVWLGRNVGGDRFGGFLELAEWRGGVEGKVTYWRLVEVTAGRLWDYYGPVPLAVGGMWIVLCASRLYIDPLVVVLVLGNLTYIVLFKQAASIHNFFISFASPAVAAAAGAGIVGISSAMPAPRTRIAVASYLAVLFIVTDLSVLPATHRRSYSVRPPDQPSRGFPLDGRLDQTLVARFMNGITGSDDLVVFHRTIHPTIPMYYYLDRAHSFVSAAAPPPSARLFVASERELKGAEAERLAAEHALYRMFGYLIFDLSRKGPDEKEAVFVALPRTLVHSYLVSSFYPPHDVRWQRVIRPRRPSPPALP